MQKNLWPFLYGLQRKIWSHIREETNGTFFRTYFMLSWKYAAIYHILLKEEGTEIQAKSFDYGIKVSLMFLSSIKRFLDYKVDLKSGAKEVRKEYLKKQQKKN